jgi:hypothetical protein
MGFSGLVVEGTLWRGWNLTFLEPLTARSVGLQNLVPREPAVFTPISPFIHARIDKTLPVQ